MVYTRPKTVTHPSTNRARRALTSFMRRTPLTTTPRLRPVADLEEEVEAASPLPFGRRTDVVTVAVMLASAKLL